MKNARLLLLSALAAVCAAAPARAQAPASPLPMLGPTLSPEQAELNRITAENLTADQRTRKKLQQLNDEKEELRVQYELLLQKQKLKIAELEGELNALSSENKLGDEKRRRGLAALQAEIEKLSLENKLASEKHQRDLDLLQADLFKAGTENKLAEEKRKAQGFGLDSQIETLAMQNKLAEEQAKAGLAKQSEELQKLSLENSLAAEKNKQSLRELSVQLDKLKLANDLKAEREREGQIADDRERRSIEMAMKRMDLEERRIKYDILVADSRQSRLKSDLELREKRWEWKKEANVEPLYLRQPFKEGRLVISDRRVPLNGPIFTGVATYVTERIHYFNNISSAPIFIVIDRCPGGSVMEGYRIVKAMQASKAPVYVVVKSFAASMAAVITTLADKSYVYPNAIVLHHQMSTMNWGNMTQLKEQLELAREWEKRLHAPVAKKMGISLEAFRKKMYEKNSDGDWEEFGDQAVGYKWAGAVVEEIDETGFLKNPDFEAKPPKPAFWIDEKTDEKGQRYVALPRLDPFDFYFIYNPDRYYR